MNSILLQLSFIFTLVSAISKDYTRTLPYKFLATSEDLVILNFALAFERLESTFYSQGLQNYSGQHTFILELG
jgi:hypothetical protein